MDMDVAAALSSQAGLAGVQWLLGDSPALEALCAALVSLLAPGISLGKVTLQRAKYKPGRYMQAYYAAELHGPQGNSTRLVEVNWLPPGKPDPRGAAEGIPAMQAEIVERGLAAPFSSLAFDDPAWGLWAQVSPLDAEYPQLARLSDPAYVYALLAADPAVRSDAAA